MPTITSAVTESASLSEQMSHADDCLPIAPEEVIPESPIQASNPPMHPMITRLKRGIQKPKAFDDYHCYSAAVLTNNYDDQSLFSGFTAVSAITTALEPRTFRGAKGKPEWEQAMQEEITALHNQGTWELVPCPSNKNIVSCKWIYKIKKGPDGHISRYKARLVARGYSQEKGLDYEETFSPVIRHTTVRVVLALAAKHKWILRQLDVKNAFLHGELKEEVYMQQPQGFVDAACPDHVCLLKKSLYGLKQAPRAWNQKFTSFLPSLGFQVSHSDPSLFVRYTAAGIVILLLYVDDMVITGSDGAGIKLVIDALHQEFEMKDLGTLTYFLGIHVQAAAQGLFISQHKYATDLLIRAGMDSSKPCNSPCLPHTQLVQDQGIPLADPTQYRSIVGALQYLTFTRPDITYAVNLVCQFMSRPTEDHYNAVKRILRYIKGTQHKGLFYAHSTYSTSPFYAVTLSAFCDADWAGEPVQRRSTT